MLLVLLASLPALALVLYTRLEQRRLAMTATPEDILDPALAQANQLFALNLAALALVVIFTLAATWLFSNLFILRQIRALVATTRRLAAGDLSVRVRLSGNAGELGQLAQALDHMAQSLEQQTARRSQVEEALRESEASFRHLFANNPHPMWVYDLETLAFLEVNEAAISRYGYSRDEFLQRRITDIRPPEDVPLLLQDVQQPRPAFQSSGSWRHRLKDGRIIDIDIASHRLNFAGRPAALVVAQDITQRKQAEEQVRQNAARAEALARVATRLNAQLNLDTVLGAICQETAQALDVPIAIVYLCDEKQGILYQAEAFGVSPEERRRLQPVPRAVYEEIIDRLGPAGVIPNLQSQPGLPNTGFYTAHDIRTAAFTLMRRNGSLVGSLSIFSVGQERAFDAAELALLKGLADQAAQAINNANLLEETQRRFHQLQALNAIDRAITARLSLPGALDVVLEQVLTQLQVDAASVLLLDQETQLLVYAAGRGFHTPAVRRLRLPVGEGYAGRAALERRVIYVPNLAEAEGLAHAALLAGEDFVTYYVVPLVAEQQVIGVLNLFHRSPLELDPDRFAFLESLAAQAAIAIDNASLYLETRLLLEKTQEQARQVQEIMDTMPEGVLLLDHDQRIVLMNPAAQAYLPVLASPVNGDRLERLGDRPLAELLAPLAPDAPWHEVALPDQERFFEVVTRPVQTDSIPTGWVMVVRDVSQERRQWEHFHAQERLATVGQLAAGIAHDFNNIMAVITLYSGTLAKNPDHPKRARYLTTMIEQAQHASRLINQILDFSRRSVMERSRFDLLSFVKEVVRLLQRTLPENVTVKLNAGAAEYPVDADPTRLQQVLMNLAINARDAMPGGGALHITLSRLNLSPGQPPPLPDMAPGDWIILAVSDTGTGISSDALPHIFEPFFTTKQPGKGTGLGLAQVYGIIKQHGGEIGVASQVGQGTTFTIYLPAANSAGPAGTAPEPAVLPASSQETILVVEDNPIARAAMESTLDSLGYHVLAAADGREALDLFTQHRETIDIVLSDMVMPEMGGVELYEALCEVQPGVKVVVMTGYPLDDEGRTLLEQGIVAWVQKPFSPAQIGTVIHKALET